MPGWVEKENYKELTGKQKVFAKEYIRTLNKTEAAMKAYDVKNRENARSLGARVYSKVRTPIQRLLDEMGLTDEAIAQDLMEGRKADKIQVIEGKVVKAPDWSNRHKYTRLTAELKDMFPKQKVELSTEDGKSLNIKITEDDTFLGTAEVIEGELDEDTKETKD